MNKNNKKRKFKYGLSTIFFLAIAAIYIFYLTQDILNGRGKFVHDLIWLVISILISLGNYWAMKDVGTIDDEDERDNYVEMKTNNLMYKITNRILFISGIVSMAGGYMIYTRRGNNSLFVVLVAIGVVLLLIWNLIMIINLVILVINYAASI